MAFLGYFNRALIGFPIKKYDRISGVAAVNKAQRVALEAKATADNLQSQIQNTILNMKKRITKSNVQNELFKSKIKSYYWLEVEFNPSTMRYTAMNGSFQQQQSVTGDIGSHIAQYNIDAQTNMNFEIFIDSTMCLSATTGMSISSATSAVANLVKGRDYYNIEPIVDGLCSLCNDVETQYVIFAWGHMVFYGVLEEVDAEYVMFDVDGKPIRAKVSMNIRQSGKLGKDDNKEDIYSKSNHYWDDAYTKFFGKGDKDLQFGSNSATKSMKDFNNILNLK